MNHVIRWLREGLTCASLIIAAWVLWFGGASYINQLLAGDRASIYNAIASIAATLLGFALAAVSILLVYSTNARLAVVREQDGFPDVVRVFFAAIRSFGAATLTAIFAMVFDRDRAPSAFFFCICIVSVAWAVGDFIRCMYVFEKVVLIIVAPSKARRGDKA